MPQPLNDARDLEATRVARYEVLLKLKDEGLVARSLARAHGPDARAHMVELSRVQRGPGRDVEVRAAFFAEARAAARVRHPNFVHPIDTLVHDGELYGVTDFILGVRLDELQRAAYRRDRAMPLGVSARIVLDLLAGLSALHANRAPDPAARVIVHGDVAPTNVVIDYRGGARIVHSGLSSASVRIGNNEEGSDRLAYKAPEQLRTGTNVALDPTADVFAVGVLLWECLAGQRLFSALDQLEVVERILNSAIPFAPIDAVAPAQLVAIVGTALERSPERRYPSAIQLAETLSRANVAIASQLEVSAFVDDLLGEVLRSRRERLQAWVSQAEEGAVSLPAMLASSEPRRARSLRTPVGVIYAPEGIAPSSARMLSARTWAPSHPASGTVRATAYWPSDTLTARPRAPAVGSRPLAAELRSPPREGSSVTLTRALVFWLLTLCLAAALAYGVSRSTWWQQAASSPALPAAPSTVRTQR
jgi:serine/threonine protein kinase